MLKQKKLWIDSLLGTSFIFVLIYLIFNVSQFGIFDLFDPIGDAIGDMEFTDIVFSQLREDPMPDTNIVVVNFGQLSRGEIAAQIEILSKYDPKVIGIDSFFSKPKEDTLGDMMLSDAIRNAGNVVLVSKLIDFDTISRTFNNLKLSHPMFSDYSENAFANLVTDNDALSQEDFKVTRSFVPKKDLGGDPERREIAFGCKLAQVYDKEKAGKYLRRKNEVEVINYRGNIMDLGRSNFGTKFFALDWMQVFEEDFHPSIVKDKIVIMGYLGDDFGDNSLEDKFFTPLNPTYAGKANPDMYGVVIHANIVSMILNEDYVNILPSWMEHFIGGIMTFLNILFFSIIYRTLPKWYDGTTKLIQVLELIILLFLLIMIFHRFALKLTLTLGFAGIALAGDGLEVFYGVVMNLFSREGRAEIVRVNK
jgi:CHASE2 domain-containing sensor protein